MRVSADARPKCVLTFGAKATIEEQAIAYEIDDFNERPVDASEGCRATTP